MSRQFSTAPGLLRHDDGQLRCAWCGQDDTYVTYHDLEWGVPVHDDRRLFEKLCLEGFQAGLSWLTILRKRPAFREAFADFEPEILARFTEGDIDRLMSNPLIVRHRGKIAATITNARAYLDLVEREGSLAQVVWSFAESDPPAPFTEADVRQTSPASHALARRLIAAGFRFIGPTTAYAFMQSMGIVNDHLVGCFRRAMVAGLPAGGPTDLA